MIDRVLDAVRVPGAARVSVRTRRVARRAIQLALACLAVTVTPLAAQLVVGQAVVSEEEVVAEVRPLEFPRDHGAHPDASEEWWSFTGHVKTVEGDWFGYQVTFYRLDADSAVVTDAAQGWGLRAVYPASISVTDIHGRTHRYLHGLERNGVGTASTDEVPVLRHRAWLIRRHDDGAWTIRAVGKGISLDLALEPTKGPVPIGPNGVVTPGPAGYSARRYALSRLTTTGTLQLGDDPAKDVRGVSWMDHVFGDGFLDRNEAGWDAMVLHFRDGSDLAVYRTRAMPGKDMRRVGGAYVSATGTVIPLEGLQTRFYPLGANRWAGANTTGSYPLLWRIEIPSLAIKLDLEATVRDQEINALDSHGLVFWRGSVEGRGRRGDHEVSAAGYLELMGYGRRFPPAVREGLRRPVVAVR